MTSPLASPVPLSTRRTRITLTLTTAGLLALATLGCERQPMNLMVVTPLTGADAAIGRSAEQGARLAHEQLRSQGLATYLELDVHDSASDPEVARREMRHGFDKGAVAAVAGITEVEAQALATLADDLERVVLSPSSTDQHLSADHEHFYRLGTSASVVGTTVANFAADELSLTTMALLARSEAEADAVAEGLVSTFERQHGVVVARAVTEGDVDLAEAARRVVATKPQAVMLAGGGTWSVDAIVALRAARFDGQIFAPQALATPANLEALGGKGQGVLIATVPFDPSAVATAPVGDATSAFVAAYRERWGEEPDIYAAEAWDAVHVLARALEDRPNLPRSVRDWLRDDGGDPTGVTGYLQFDGSGAVTKYPRVYSVTEDLALRDHAVWLAAERQRIEDKRRKLIEQMNAASNQLASAAG